MILMPECLCIESKMYHGSLVRWAFGVLVSVIKMWHLVVG